MNQKKEKIKGILIGLLCILGLFATTGCINYDACNSCTFCGNKQMFDMNYTFNYAIIQLPNGSIIEGNIETWNDYDNDTLQIRINDVTYLVHSVNCVLMYK